MKILPLLALTTACSLLSQTSVVTNRYDNLGTGANLHERSLKVASGVLYGVAREM